MDPFSPMPSEKKYGNLHQETEGCSKDWWPKTATEEKFFADRARCANVILSLKKQVITLLDEAASNVLEALTFIGAKARHLEGVVTTALDPEKQDDALDKKPEVSAAIKANVSKASDKIAKLQAAMVQLWDSLCPKAIGSLDISPSDFDDYLSNLQIA